MLRSRRLIIASRELQVNFAHLGPRSKSFIGVENEIPENDGKSVLDRIQIEVNAYGL